MVEAHTFARSIVLKILKVNIQYTSHSSVLKCFKDLRQPRPFFSFEDVYPHVFNRLEIGMQCVSEELKKRYKQCK